MSRLDFSTAENNQEPATEVNCLKAMLTLMLQAMASRCRARDSLKWKTDCAGWMMKLPSGGIFQYG